MRTRITTVIAAAAVGMSVFAATPASAATLITPDYCAAEGGSYTSSKSVKSCTTVATEIVNDVLAVDTAPEPDPANPGGTVYYQTRYLVYVGLETTKVQSQRANRPVTTTSTTVEKYRDKSLRSCTAFHEAAGVPIYTTGCVVDSDGHPAPPTEVL